MNLHEIIGKQQVRIAELEAEKSNLMLIIKGLKDGTTNLDEVFIGPPGQKPAFGPKHEVKEPVAANGAQPDEG